MDGFLDHALAEVVLHLIVAKGIFQRSHHHALVQGEHVTRYLPGLDVDRVPEAPLSVNIKVLAQGRQVLQGFTRRERKRQEGGVRRDYAVGVGAGRWDAAWSRPGQLSKP